MRYLFSGSRPESFSFREISFPESSIGGISYKIHKLSLQNSNATLHYCKVAKVRLAADFWKFPFGKLPHKGSTLEALLGGCPGGAKPPLGKEKRKSRTVLLEKGQKSTCAKAVSLGEIVSEI
ncbi:MAG: hypothetical protein J1E06_04990 [Acutalibacter sp.]|nr:hypothetical protein [Acutalibacter sp.]